RGRRVEARDGELHAAAVLQLDDRLHAALAERRGADDDRAAVVLERAGDDLAGAGGAAVDEDHDRIVRLGVLGVGALDLGVAAAAALGGDDDAVEEEPVGDLHRLLEEAAGVVAQIENQALEPPAGLQTKIIERLLQIDVGAILE